VEEALAWLQSQGYLSDSRFAQSRVHVRSSRFGNLRIQQELSRHQVVITPEMQQELVASEVSRARSVHQRKFGDTPACSLADRAKQTRFLMQRGFSSEVIRRVVGRAPVADSESTDIDD
jgi:regulatory protein